MFKKDQSAPVLNQDLNFVAITSWILNSSILTVILIFNNEKTEADFLSEEMDILIPPLKKSWTPNRLKKKRRGNSPEDKLKVFGM